MANLGEDTGGILLVGGDSDAAEMYRMKLVLDGHRVIAVADNHAAKALARARRTCRSEIPSRHAACWLGGTPDPA